THKCVHRRNRRPTVPRLPPAASDTGRGTGASILACRWGPLRSACESNNRKALTVSTGGRSLENTKPGGTGNIGTLRPVAVAPRAVAAVRVCQNGRREWPRTKQLTTALRSVFDHRADTSAGLGGRGGCARGRC